VGGSGEKHICICSVIKVFWFSRLEAGLLCIYVGVWFGFSVLSEFIAN
jgi:hypothetical protein